jgi:hypothetical protein
VSGSRVVDDYAAAELMIMSQDSSGTTDAGVSNISFSNIGFKSRQINCHIQSAR